MGPELIANGKFASSSGWTFGTGWSLGTALASHASGTAALSRAAIGTLTGKTYRVGVLITGTLGSVTISLGNGASTFVINMASTNPGFFTKNILADISVSASITITPTTDFNGTITSVTVKQILGTLPSYTASVITAVAKVVQGLAAPTFIFGGQQGTGGGATWGLFKKSTTYVFALFRSAVYRYNVPFGIMQIRFSIHAPLATGMEITPVLHFDGDSASVAGTPINTTNYTAGKTSFKVGVASFGNNVRGKADFFLELQHTGTVLCGIKLPVYIDVDIDELP